MDIQQPDFNGSDEKVLSVDIDGVSHLEIPKRPEFWVDIDGCHHFSVRNEE